jgi:hypothetical protein
LYKGIFGTFSYLLTKSGSKTAGFSNTTKQEDYTFNLIIGILEGLFLFGLIFTYFVLRGDIPWPPKKIPGSGETDASGTGTDPTEPTTTAAEDVAAGGTTAAGPPGTKAERASASVAG